MLSLIYPSKTEGKWRHESMDVEVFDLRERIRPHFDPRESIVCGIVNKPDFPPAGLALDCPHCGKSATYERHELRYRGPG